MNQFRSVLALFLLLGSAAAFAQVTYTYQGNNYEVFEPPYSATSSITGSIELASALAPNTTIDLVPLIQAFSFGDGQAVRNETNTILCQFDVSTNAQGRITSWSIFLRQSDTAPTGNQHTIDMFSDTPVQQSGFDAGQGNTDCSGTALSPFGASNSAPLPNAWSGGSGVQPTAVPTLSPATLVLMLLLFLGVVGFRFK